MLHKAPLVIVATLLSILLPAGLDYLGHAELSAVAIIPVFTIFWIITRKQTSRRDIGMTFGKMADYKWAFYAPLFTLGLVTITAYLAGEIDTSKTDWVEVVQFIVLIGLSNAIISLLTEEGFFRGWLWAMLKDMKPEKRLVITTIPFMILHVSFATLEAEFALPLGQLFVYLVGAVVLGMTWGMMREMSGSIIMTAFAHGLWNGLVYPLFGIGTRTGALGIENVSWFGPERGVIGLSLNIIFALILYRAYKKHLKHVG